MDPIDTGEVFEWRYKVRRLYDKASRQYDETPSADGETHNKTRERIVEEFLNEQTPGEIPGSSWELVQWDGDRKTAIFKRLELVNGSDGGRDG